MFKGESLICIIEYTMVVYYKNKFTAERKRNGNGRKFTADFKCRSIIDFHLKKKDEKKQHEQACQKKEVNVVIFYFTTSCYRLIYESK